MVALALGELTDFHRKGESLREVCKAKLALETRNPIRRNEHPFRNLRFELRGFRLTDRRSIPPAGNALFLGQNGHAELSLETCCSSVKLVAF